MELAQHQEQALDLLGRKPGLHPREVRSIEAGPVGELLLSKAGVSAGAGERSAELCRVGGSQRCGHINTIASAVAVCADAHNSLAVPCGRYFGVVAPRYRGKRTGPSEAPSRDKRAISP